MTLDQISQFAPTFALVFFRVAGMMLFAPLFGSAKIPRRVRLMLALVLTVGMLGSVPAVPRLPDSGIGIALGIGGEMLFGLAMGMVLSFVFVAVQWAGEMIGQQMGFNLSEVFDPQFGAQGSVVGELYFMMSLVIFLGLNGHHAMLRGVRDSFEAMPLLSLGVGGDLLALTTGLFQASTELAVQLAAPMLVTMLVVDLSLGFISKTVPQLNVMTAGMTVRSMVGMLVMIVGLVMTSNVMRQAIVDSMVSVRNGWVGSLVHAG
ncbi:MAG: flagellar biosynthetic protein FliR [Phycisphaerales bacterium]|nr:flagellar biosynthetic protein FliR [Phycisphaerales bacterium]